MHTPLEVAASVSFKLEKYADGVTQEDINAGRAVPIEVIHTEPSRLTEEEMKALGIKEE